jgi:indole-3-glycerol phosphate synthase
VQAFPAWAPPGGTLGQIVAEARKRADDLMRRRPVLEARAARQEQRASLVDALRRLEVGVIAEVKRRSPSRGEINSALSAGGQAAAYGAGGAAAISVLTEPRHFGGSGDDLVAARDAVQLPLLKKDFHVDGVQLLEAKALGASGALLIARALEPRQLTALVAEACAIGLDPLVEVRTEAELEVALSSGAPIVGVNARTLETLALDLAVFDRLLPLIPSDRVAVAESGVRSAADVRRAAECGADAVLVGSMLSQAPDPSLAVRALTGVSRVGRAT